MKITAAAMKKLGLDPGPWKPRKGPKRPQDGLGKPKPTDNAFLLLCESYGLPTPDAEYVFAPPRKWRFDWLFDGWLAVEVEGGAWTQGRHNRAVGFLADMEKYNRAVQLGYSVLRFTPKQMQSGLACEFIKVVLQLEAEQS